MMGNKRESWATHTMHHGALSLEAAAVVAESWCALRLNTMHCRPPAGVFFFSALHSWKSEPACYQRKGGSSSQWWIYTESFSESAHERWKIGVCRGTCFFFCNIFWTHLSVAAGKRKFWKSTRFGHNFLKTPVRESWDNFLAGRCIF